MIIDCVNLANLILEEVKKNVEILKNKNIFPTLAIVKNNQNNASDKYVSIKLKKAAELGINTLLIQDFSNEKELIEIINKLNKNDKINGYIVQLPLPKEFDKEFIFENISPFKDVDGLSMHSVYRSINNSLDYYPKSCTAYGIMEILDYIKYDLKGKNVVIINRSAIVGKPLLALMLQKDATVTICHSKTENLKEITKTADVVVVAIGRPYFLTKDMIKKGCVVIDAGISVVNNKVVGDVDFENVEKVASFITKVPNGVGKLTVAMIFKNLMDLINQKYNGILSCNNI